MKIGLKHKIKICIGGLRLNYRIDQVATLAESSDTEIISVLIAGETKMEFSLLHTEKKLLLSQNTQFLVSFSIFFRKEKNILVIYPSFYMETK